MNLSLAKALWRGLAALGLLCASHSHAALWQLNALARAGVDYQDNLRLTQRDPLADSSQSVGVDLDLQQSMLHWQNQLKFGLTTRHFLQEEDFNSDDQNLGFNSRWRQPRLGVQLGANHQRDTSLVSELEVSGLVQDRVRRTLSSAHLGSDYALSEKTLLASQLSVQQVQYEAADQSGLADYDYSQLSAQMQRSLTPSHRTFLSLSLSQFETDVRQQQVQDTGLTLGLEGVLSYRWDYSLSLGWRDTRTESVVFVPNLLLFTLEPVVLNRSDQGTLVNVTLSRKFATHQLDLSVQRSTRPSGSGEFLESDTLSLGQQGRVLPRIGWRNQVRWVQNRATDTDSVTSERDYYLWQPGLTWQQSREALISVSYRFQYQEFGDQDLTADGHTVLFNYQYRWSIYRRAI